MLMNQIFQQKHCQLGETPLKEVRGKQNLNPDVWKSSQIWSINPPSASQKMISPLLIVAFRKLWYGMINKALQCNKTTAVFLRCYFLEICKLRQFV